MEDNSIVLHAQHANALQAKVLLQVIIHLLVTCKGGGALSSNVNHC